ncbi:phage portal protein [Acinetobacter sp. ANC 4641]|uniref:phage portal protein n=1 Tax=Acinetobacter sp. ANC 4641 TaxID=2529847 RepID=UPI00103F3D23|nr:phage portal protein [Acinetobacter sp. ANC 4641]TCB11447.1 phage portal protein [Acinetobacter sp. ANC 4641]
MDFITLKDTYPKDSDLPDRTAEILALSRVIDGSMYETLHYDFSVEKDPAGQYISLSKRRPSARTRLCATVVNDSVSLLFSEGHFPSCECSDEQTRDKLEKIIKESKLNEVMLEAAVIGSVGSVAVLMRVLSNRVFFKAMNTAYLTPKWKDNEPDVLEKVTERYKVKGKILNQCGYSVDEVETYWFQRDWDNNAETWYLPQSTADAKDKKPVQVDNERTTQHQLGFVPIVWIKNLPGGDDIDGKPTFPVEAIDLQIESDYLLSQGGRALKYQADPTLHIKNPAFGDQAMVKGAANAIVTSTDGDAKLLEISGDAAHAVMDWVKGLREIALEGAGGNRANADKLSAAQSGRAMELMNQSLIWLADKLRISYGEGALLDLLNMIVKASKAFKLVNKKGKEYGELSQDNDLSLRWAQWYQPTYADKQTQANTLDVLRKASLLSQETAVKSLADAYDITDPQDELRQIKADKPLVDNVPPPKSEPISQSDD